jgi:hypothetical protein
MFKRTSITSIQFHRNSRLDETLTRLSHGRFEILKYVCN